jgi:hypothetical protein
MVPLKGGVSWYKSVYERPTDCVIVLPTVIELKEREERIDVLRLKLGIDLFPDCRRDLGKNNSSFNIQHRLKLSVGFPVSKQTRLTYSLRSSVIECAIPLLE